MPMTVAEFVDYWEALNAARAAGASCAEPDRGDGNGDVSAGAAGRSSCGGDEKLLYPKDWHFVKEYPEYGAYETPPWFAEDWLNWYLDRHALRAGAASGVGEARDAKELCGSDDYRLVYMGPRAATPCCNPGTWTPVHVLASFSWSVNICVRKRWLLLPADQTHLLHNRPAPSSQPSLPLPVLHLPLSLDQQAPPLSSVASLLHQFSSGVNIAAQAEKAGNVTLTSA
eukprot:SM003367S12873  [mRNA]  locus=s3367:372:1267:+ [translate_table: standard]